MSRFGKRSLGLAASLLVLAVPLAAVLPLFGAGPGDGVPTVVVEREPFVRDVPAEGYLEAAESTPISLPAGAVRRPMRIAWLAEDGSRVDAGDPVVRFDPTDLEKEMEDARADRSASELRVGKERSTRESELAKLDRDAELAELELEDSREFQKKDEMIFSRHDIIESELDEELAEEKMEHATESRQTRESLSDAELELLAIERRKADLALERAQAGLDALTLEAPHAGLVIFRRSWRGELPRVGDTAFPGNVLAEIPDLSEMEAEVYVLEADAGGLAEGRPARVVLEAHPERVFDATVAQVDNLAKPRRRGSPVQYFAVVLALEETVPELMKPGQRVRARLRMEELDEALTVPRQAIFEQDGDTVVYRRRAGGGFEPVAVELGPAALGRVVIASGLEAGDRIALADPTRAAETRFAGEGEEGEGGGPLSAAPGGGS